MVLFKTPGVTEPFFRAEVDVFARLSGQSPGFSGLLLKNAEAGAEVPFIYLAQWGSEEARQEIRSSRAYASALELARVQNTEVMEVLELQRVD